MLILLIIDFDQSLNQAYRADGKSRTWLTSTYESHRPITKSDGMWFFLAFLVARLVTLYRSEED
jgi:hypothetical protein